MPYPPTVAVRRLLMTADTVGGVWTYALELAQALQHYHIDLVLGHCSPQHETLTLWSKRVVSACSTRS